MFFEVERRVSRSRAEVEKAQDKENGKDKKAPPGRYYVPQPKTRDGSDLPTFAEWLADQDVKKGRK